MNRERRRIDEIARRVTFKMVGRGREPFNLHLVIEETNPKSGVSGQVGETHFGRRTRSVQVLGESDFWIFL